MYHHLFNKNWSLEWITGDIQNRRVWHREEWKGSIFRDFPDWYYI